MIERIIFSLLSFLIFAYIFLFKMMKKNDTTYLTILLFQAIGILMNLIRVLFDVLTGVGSIIVMYLFSIVIPLVVIILEYKNLNCSEWLQIALAKIYMLFNNDKKAKEVLINIVSKYDNSYTAHKILAEIYEKEGGMRKAIDEYVKVLDLKPNDYVTYFKISILLKELGKRTESIQMLKTLVSKKPEMKEANKMLADMLLEDKKYKQAITIYVQAIKYDPDNAELYYNLGVAYSRMNEFSLAKECYKKTVEIDSGYYNAFYRLGQISLLYRDIESAEKYFLESIYGETESKSYYQLSKIYMIKNDKTKAATNINTAIQMDYKYYKIAVDEPIFLPIKQLIIKPTEETKPEIAESEQEKEISEYLDDTYNLTKYLNVKKNK
ncbi:MAG: tetratricopeptide repeat protein [Clostridia bacterium]